MDGVATVVSSGAALGALVFAWLTVRETRALRREDRLARLPELVAELGEFALNAGQPTPRYVIRRARVAAMLAPLDEPLESCRVIASGQMFERPADLTQDQIGSLTLAALDELADLSRTDR